MKIEISITLDDQSTRCITRFISEFELEMARYPESIVSNLIDEMYEKLFEKQ
ncbi:hypothetical protein JCM17380_24440 [Desulfosporosinus burensis]